MKTLVFKIANSFRRFVRVQSCPGEGNERYYYRFTYCRESYINPRLYILFSIEYSLLLSFEETNQNQLLYFAGELYLSVDLFFTDETAKMYAKELRI